MGNCSRCGFPIFHGVVGYAGPMCSCKWPKTPIVDGVNFYQQQEMAAHKECDELQSQLAERDKLLEQREATILEQQANFEQFMQLFCNAADNIGDLPISEDWAEKWDAKATELLDRTNYGRHDGALESALKAERLAGKIEGLEEVIAEWGKPYGLTDGSRFEVRLRRMADGLRK